MRILLTTALLSLFAISCNQPNATGIRNTATFITYFTGIENMKNYKPIKEDAEKLAQTVKSSSTISSSDKNILKGFYDDVQAKSEAFYSQVVNDLLSKEKRREIRDNFSGYVQSINNQFEGIKSSGAAFTTRYKQITGEEKGIFAGWLIKQFMLPLLQGFVEEVIDSFVRQKLDANLKPLIVLKPWSSI